MDRKSMKLAAVALLLTCLASLGALLPTASAAQGAPTNLKDLWLTLEGKTGVLEQTNCGNYVFTPSRPTQVGNATIQEVQDDHIVIFERRNGEEWEFSIPFERLTLRRSRG